MLKKPDVRTKSFLTATGIILLLMVASYILTLAVPGGAYTRDADGVIDQSVPFESVAGGLPLWKAILSPVLVLFADGGGTVIAVLVFLLVIGGVFESLNQSGLMQYMLDRITTRFGAKKYRLMAVIMFFFMAMGSLIGSFEECVPLVPIVVTLAVALGWDALTGMAMSLLSVGCGFAAGVFNPFTVGVAQRLAGLTLFSGAWLRAVAFALIYALLLIFTGHHAKKVEKPARTAGAGSEASREMGRALACFAGILGCGILVVLSSALPLPFADTIQDLSMIIVAVAFLVAGVTSVLVAKKGMSFLLRTFLKGLIGMLPAMLMIMMASSVRYILQEANILDTILHAIISCSAGMPRACVILFIYLIVLVMNFFVASGSAKAVMLIPLIVPLAQAFDIPAQLCVMAFAFGDGFSNVFYPTNPALLISLGLADVGYGAWAKWSWKFQAANLLLTAGLLLFGLAAGYH